MSESGSSTDSPKRFWRHEKGKKDVYGEVKERTLKGQLWGSAKDLVISVACVRPSDQRVVEDLILGQYQLAMRKKKYSFVQELRKWGPQILSDDYIREHLGRKVSGRRVGQTLGMRSARGSATGGMMRAPAKAPTSTEQEFPVLRKRESTNEEGQSELSVPMENTREPEQVSVKLEPCEDVEELEQEEGEEGEFYGQELVLEGMVASEEESVTGEEAAMEGGGEEEGEEKLEVPSAKDSDVEVVIVKEDVIVISDNEGSQDRGRERDRRLRERDEVSRDRSRSRSEVKVESKVVVNSALSKAGTKGSRYLLKCPIQECGSFRNLRRHVMTRHLPPRFRTGEVSEEVQKSKIEGLSWLAKALLGNTSTLGILMHFVRSKVLYIPREAYPSEKDCGWMRDMCARERWESPEYFLFFPPNSRALLAHWRVLGALVRLLPPQQRAEFLALDEEPEVFQVVDEVGFEEETSLVVTARSGPVDSLVTTAREVVVVSEETSCPARKTVNTTRESQNSMEVVDSHFHLDRALAKLGKSLNNGVEELLNADVGREPRVPVRVTGGVAVFCDPATWPDSFNLVEGFGAAVGVHPRNVGQFDREAFRRMKRVLKSDGVVALGEVGLDRTEPRETWELQERVLIQLLELSSPGVPVVIHLRDGEDRHAGELGAKGLRILRENVAPTQRIHLHCFSGTVEQVIGWMECFPRCYFGFTANVRFFNTFQEAAVRRVPGDRLLLETDSPYLRTSAGARVNTPAFLGEIAEAVAQIRNTSIQEVCRVTATNARVLYGL